MTELDLGMALKFGDTKQVGSAIGDLKAIAQDMLDLEEAEGKDTEMLVDGYKLYVPTEQPSKGGALHVQALTAVMAGAACIMLN